MAFLGGMGRALGAPIRAMGGGKIMQKTPGMGGMAQRLGLGPRPQGPPQMNPQQQQQLGGVAQNMAQRFGGGMKPQYGEGMKPPMPPIQGGGMGGGVMRPPIGMQSPWMPRGGGFGGGKMMGQGQPQMGQVPQGQEQMHVMGQPAGQPMPGEGMQQDTMQAAPQQQGLGPNPQMMQNMMQRRQPMGIRAPMGGGMMGGMGRVMY